jgi:hypothetical protein
MLRIKPHRFKIAGKSFTGRVAPYRLEGDDTPPEEGIEVGHTWRVMVDAPDDCIVFDAPVTDVVLIATDTLLEAGPLYIRQIDHYQSGLPTSHVKIVAMAYRGEA